MKKCYWIINSDARLLHWSPDEKEAFEIVGVYGTFTEEGAAEDEPPPQRDHRIGTGEGHFITQALVNMRHAAAVSPLYWILLV